MSSALATYSPSYGDIPGVRGSDFLGWLAPQTKLLRVSLEELSSLEYIFKDAVVEVVIDPGALGNLTFPQNAVEAVEYLKNSVQLPRDQVLDAVGIAKRTFFGWGKAKTRLPRKKSLGELWPMVNTISGIRRVNPSFHTWFQNSTEAQRLFAAGDSDGLAMLDLRDRSVGETFTSTYNPGDDFYFYENSISGKKKIAEAAARSEGSTRASSVGSDSTRREL